MVAGNIRYNLLKALMAGATPSGAGIKQEPYPPGAGTNNSDHYAAFPKYSCHVQNSECWQKNDSAGCLTDSSYFKFLIILFIILMACM